MNFVFAVALEAVIVASNDSDRGSGVGANGSDRDDERRAWLSDWGRDGLTIHAPCISDFSLLLVRMPSFAIVDRIRRGISQIKCCRLFCACGNRKGE